MQCEDALWPAHDVRKLITNVAAPANVFYYVEERGNAMYVASDE